MSLVTRLFTAADGVNIWDLLNEVKGWIDTLRDQGTAARYWTSYPATKALGDGKNVSVPMSTQTGTSGGVVPTWAGDGFTLPAGKYRIDIQVRFDQASGGYRTLSLMLNPGVTTYNSSSNPPGTYLRSAQFASSSNDTTVQMTKIVTVVDTDVLMIIARQTSGSTTNIVGGTQQDSEMMIERIGD